MEKKYYYGVMVNALLTVFAVIAYVSGIIKYGIDVSLIVLLVMFGLVLYYAVAGYKKPHGNLLKYLIIIFGLSQLVTIYDFAKYAPVKDTMVAALTMSLITYIGGRLNKINENKFLMVVVLLLLAHIYLGVFTKYGCDSLFTAVRLISPIIIWLDLCGAYFTRFASHKEAGIEIK